MDDNLKHAFEQAASFQKLWMDSLGDVAKVWAEFSPGEPPPEALRKLRSGLLRVLAQTTDDFMRTPQFMEMMKHSMNGAVELGRLSKEGMSRVHEQFGTAGKDDVDGILLALRHVERRILDRLDDLDGRIERLERQVHDGAGAASASPAASKKSPRRKRST